MARVNYCKCTEEGSFKAQPPQIEHSFQPGGRLLESTKIPCHQRLSRRRTSKIVKRSLGSLNNCSVPQTSLDTFTSCVDENFEEEKQRYVSIMLKAQNAMSNRQAGFMSPRILRNFLITKKSFKSLENSSERSASTRTENSFPCSEVKEKSDYRIRQETPFRGKKSTFASRRMT
ncbi:unnamed protein product [Moneuplotes crassus]|uniref:Uncharacterized protein n=1 Tax=Euplotes crassus TaxID=5936 RepID=A0AAD1UDX1_EUPCR|nr:unnamed protein product [Moneuplotes crassus]